MCVITFLKTLSQKLNPVLRLCWALLQAWGYPGHSFPTQYIELEMLGPGDWTLFCVVNCILFLMFPNGVNYWFLFSALWALVNCRFEEYCSTSTCVSVSVTDVTSTLFHTNHIFSGDRPVVLEGLVGMVDTWVWWAPWPMVGLLGPCVSGWPHGLVGPVWIRTVNFFLLLIVVIQKCNISHFCMNLERWFIISDDLSQEKIISENKYKCHCWGDKMTTTQSSIMALSMKWLKTFSFATSSERDELLLIRDTPLVHICRTCFSGHKWSFMAIWPSDHMP